MPTVWHRVTINIPPELAAALKHLARLEKISVAKYVTRLVENHIATVDPVEVEERRAKLERAVASFARGSEKESLRAAEAPASYDTKKLKHVTTETPRDSTTGQRSTPKRAARGA